MSFSKLLGNPLKYAKTTWNGQAIRRRALTEAGFELPERLEEVGSVPPADILDATVAAWTARRVAEKRAGSFPPHADRGARPVIWF